MLRRRAVASVVVGSLLVFALAQPPVRQAAPDVTLLALGDRQVNW